MLSYEETEFPSHYATLGIESDAGPAEIRRAYLKLAKAYHPDKNPNNKKAAHEKFAAINIAHEILSNEDKKKTYDELREDQSYNAADYEARSERWYREPQTPRRPSFSAGSSYTTYEYRNDRGETRRAYRPQYPYRESEPRPSGEDRQEYRRPGGEYRRPREDGTEYSRPAEDYRRPAEEYRRPREDRAEYSSSRETGHSSPRDRHGEDEPHRERRERREARDDGETKERREHREHKPQEAPPKRRPSTLRREGSRKEREAPRRAGHREGPAGPRPMESPRYAGSQQKPHAEEAPAPDDRELELADAQRLADLTDDLSWIRQDAARKLSKLRKAFRTFEIEQNDYLFWSYCRRAKENIGFLEDWEAHFGHVLATGPWKKVRTAIAYGANQISIAVKTSDVIGRALAAAQDLDAEGTPEGIIYLDAGRKDTVWAELSSCPHGLVPPPPEPRKKAASSQSSSRQQKSERERW